MDCALIRQWRSEDAELHHRECRKRCRNWKGRGGRRARDYGQMIVIEFWGEVPKMTPQANINGTGKWSSKFWARKFSGSEWVQIGLTRIRIEFVWFNFEKMNKNWQSNEPVWKCKDEISSDTPTAKKCCRICHTSLIAFIDYMFVRVWQRSTVFTNTNIEVDISQLQVLINRWRHLQSRDYFYCNCSVLPQNYPKTATQLCE